jgi:hypothetical protein
LHALVKIAVWVGTAGQNDDAQKYEQGNVSHLQFANG